MDLASIPIAAWLIQYKYFVIFPLALLEGPMLMVLCGFLWKLGYFEFFALYLVLMAADLIRDIIWYWIGKYWAHSFVKKYGEFFGVTEAALARAESLFRSHQNKVLFVSKITMGFGFALVTLLAAGMFKIDFRKYLIFNGLGGFIWTGLLMYAGYSFGHLYLLLDRAFRNVTLFAFVALLGLFLYGLNKYLRGRYLKQK